MDSLFGLMGMMNNYDVRKVCNTKRKNFILDTALVTDRSWTYETAVTHKNFNGGAWIILEGSDTKEEAQKVHDKWLEALDKEDYDILYDCYEERGYYRQVSKN